MGLAIHSDIRRGLESHRTRSSPGFSTRLTNYSYAQSSTRLPHPFLTVHYNHGVHLHKLPTTSPCDTPPHLHTPISTITSRRSKEPCHALMWKQPRHARAPFLTTRPTPLPATATRVRRTSLRQQDCDLTVSTELTTSARGSQAVPFPIHHTPSFSRRNIFNMVTDFPCDH